VVSVSVSVLTGFSPRSYMCAEELPCADAFRKECPPGIRRNLRGALKVPVSHCNYSDY
jgi:hypothetical protein